MDKTATKESWKPRSNTGAFGFHAVIRSAAKQMALRGLYKRPVSFERSTRNAINDARIADTLKPVIATKSATAANDAMNLSRLFFQNIAPNIAEKRKTKS